MLRWGYGIGSDGSCWARYWNGGVLVVLAFAGRALHGNWSFVYDGEHGNRVHIGVWVSFGRPVSGRFVGVVRSLAHLQGCVSKWSWISICSVFLY